MKDKTLENIEQNGIEFVKLSLAKPITIMGTFAAAGLVHGLVLGTEVVLAGAGITLPNGATSSIVAVAAEVLAGYGIFIGGVIPLFTNRDGKSKEVSNIWKLW